MDFPRGPVVQTLQGAQVPFLVGELRSHMLFNVAGEKKKTRTRKTAKPNQETCCEEKPALTLQNGQGPRRYNKTRQKAVLGQRSRLREAEEPRELNAQRGSPVGSWIF